MQKLWLVAERYQVGEVVGRGGYGMVCRGVDRQTGRAVAMKMLSPAAGKDPHVVERMLREQQAMLALSGTCAATAIDLCRLPSGAPCLVMEWLDGRDLEQQLSEWEAANQLGSNDRLLDVLRPVTETLHRAHEIGIVHRDIKPANIFLTVGEPEGVRLLDFGLSRMRSAAPLTAIGMVMGSPSYIAPETWSGNSSLIDHRADLFSLAVIVFRWLTGKLPFEEPDLIGKMTAVTSGPRPSARALRPELPPSLDVWLGRALAIEPGQRFQTGRDFYAALEAALNGMELPFADPDASGVRPVVTPERKNALSAAWDAAGSLLRRFTGSREQLMEPTTESVLHKPQLHALDSTRSHPPQDAEPEGSAEGDRKSVWLDPSDLEEAVPVAAPSKPPAPAADSSPTPPGPSPAASVEEPTRPKQEKKAKKASRHRAKKAQKPKRGRRRKRAKAGPPAK